jgi:hypothetical protein
MLLILMSSGMWCCVIGQVVANISDAPRSFKMLENDHPTQCHFPAYFSIQQCCPGNCRSCIIVLQVKVKWSCYRPVVAQRVGRGIALLFHDRGTRRGWVVSSTAWLHFTPGKDPVTILQEAGWAPGPVWTGGKSRPNRDSIPDRSARSIYNKKRNCSVP